VFEPSSLTVAKGEAVTFVNNAGFPHNVVFDEDEVPVRRRPLPPLFNAAVV
jgi:plastocyanin